MALVNAKRRTRDAAESSVNVLEFRTGSAFGSYYSFTDKAPSSGEFRYFTEGLAQIVGYPILFVISSDEGSSELVSKVLLMLQQGHKV